MGYGDVGECYCGELRHNGVFCGSSMRALDHTALASQIVGEHLGFNEIHVG